MKITSSWWVGSRYVCARLSIHEAHEIFTPSPALPRTSHSTSSLSFTHLPHPPFAYLNATTSLVDCHDRRPSDVPPGAAWRRAEESSTSMGTHNNMGIKHSRTRRRGGREKESMSDLKLPGPLSLLIDDTTGPLLGLVTF